MNTNPQTKPSAGALKAAEAYVSWQGQQNEPEYIEAARLRLAQIIDQESGLAEALDALRGMVGLVQLISAREPDLQSNHRFIEAMRVIAKAENPNAETVQAFPKGRWTEKGTV